MRPLIFISGPYSNGDQVLNTHAAIRAAELLYAVGAVPYVPHLSIAWHMYQPHTPEWWYEFDLHVLARCQALYRLPGDSIGADREEAEAVHLGIPIFTDLEEVHLWIQKEREAK